MNDIKDILNYLEAIASHDATAVEELGYHSQEASEKKVSDLQYGIALGMLFLSSTNGLSEGSLDVPNQTGLSYLDQSSGALYHGPQVILVSLCLMANSIITIQQLIKERRDIDSGKIHSKRQAELKRLHTILSAYVSESHDGDQSEIKVNFGKAYHRSLHIDVQKRIIAIRDEILSGQTTQNERALVYQLPEVSEGVTKPAMLDFIHNRYETKYQPLLDMLNQIDGNDHSKISDFIKEIKAKSYVPVDALIIKQNTISNDIALKKQFINELVYHWVKNELDKAEDSDDDSDDDSVFDEIEYLDLEAFARTLEVNPNNHKYIGKSSIYNGVRYTGYGIGWFNVLVNFGIGIGAFISFNMVIYALTGVSLLALLGTGWPFFLAIAFFAVLSMLIPMLITRKYINSFFENVAYNLKLWWDSGNKLENIIQALKNKKNAMTLFVTLPTAIGLTIIAAMAFYMTMPIAPIALIIGVVTFIACVSLFGGMFYESYDRLARMIENANYKRLVVPAGMATFIMVLIGLALFLNPVTGPFMALAPISAILLMGVVSIIVFTMCFAIHGKWPLKRSMLASLGLTAAVGQSIAIFCCTAILFANPVGLVFAAVLALFSFPLFFSWAVMCVALPEDEMERHCILKECSNQNKDVKSIEMVDMPQNKPVNLSDTSRNLFGRADVEDVSDNDSSINDESEPLLKTPSIDL
ncbi:MAG: MFS transporter [Gammaproteobacteria bacterium]|nr:MFS transporter [Gammaproteobacteria bacterium]